MGHQAAAHGDLVRFLRRSALTKLALCLAAEAKFGAGRGQQIVFYSNIGSGIGGSLIGAMFNYGLALWLGRPFLLKYGRYVLISEKNFKRSEDFFLKHGEIGTFVGRLLPGIRQIISFPAGLAGMPLGKFLLFTGLGSGIWVVILAHSGGHILFVTQLYLGASFSP